MGMKNTNLKISFNAPNKYYGTGPVLSTICTTQKVKDYFGKACSKLENGHLSENEIHALQKPNHNRCGTL
jgi:hypothetical protein